MRGMLRITSSHVPFRRAGLVFATAEPLLVDIRDLDGERLLRLIKDPALTIAVGDDGDGFRPLPAFGPDANAGMLQQLIEVMAAELPAREEIVPGPALDPLEQVQRQAAIIDDLDTKLVTVTQDRDVTANRLTETQEALVESKARVVELEKQVEALSVEITEFKAAGGSAGGGSGGDPVSSPKPKGKKSQAPKA